MQDKGATLIEYALLILLLVAASLAITHVGYDLREVYCDAQAGLSPTKQFTRDNTTWSEEMNCCSFQVDNEVCRNYPPIPGGCPFPKTKACLN